jgi:hypothetical protein
MSKLEKYKKEIEDLEKEEPSMDNIKQISITQTKLLFDVVDVLQTIAKQLHENKKMINNINIKIQELKQDPVFLITEEDENHDQ